jgi:hypothetical protein
MVIMEVTEDPTMPVGAMTELESVALAAPAFVYAVGRVEARFPNLGIEKELAQATGRAETAGLTDREAVHSILSQRHNRYIARQLCWVLTIEGLETYLLYPRNPEQFELLIDALRAVPNAMDVDVVLGIRGPLSVPELCNGLVLPVLYFDQIYSFDRQALIDGIPTPPTVTKKDEARFKSSAGELLDRIMQLADNAGATDEHRALNYLAVRYPAIYARTSEAHEQNASLSAIEARPSRLSGARRVMDVILSFSNRQTDVTEKVFVRVDVTEEFPFIVTRLSPFYDR